MAFTSYAVDNDRRFDRALKRASREAGDLRLPLTLITKDFYKSNKAIFKLKGPGQYPDLQQSTIDKKERAGVPIYPILNFSGTLQKSLVSASDSNAINEIINRKTLILGTKVDYGKFHQSDRPRKAASNRAGPLLPQRKFLFIGPESIGNTPKGANIDKQGKGRLERWSSILEAHVEAVVRKRVTS